MNFLLKINLQIYKKDLKLYLKIMIQKFLEALKNDSMITMKWDLV